LVGGFESKEKEAKTGLFHEMVVFLGEAGVEAQITVQIDFFIVTSTNHALAEFGEPGADWEGAGIIHDFFDGVVFNQMADFVQGFVRRDGMAVRVKIGRP